MTATISGLFIYPVKSLGAVSLQQANVLPTGLEGDRQWMLVDHKGRFISQREIPKMATVKTAYDNQTLTLEYPNLGNISVSLNGTGNGVVKEDVAEEEVQPFQIWKDTVEGIEESEEVSNWLTEALGLFRGEKVRLVRFNNTSQRKVGTKYLEEQESDLKLADACPFLITCETSLETLNQRLPEPMPMDRFRANIVLSGTQSFQEFQWQSLKHEQLNFAMIGPCQRCPMTSIDQQQGKTVTPGQPLQTLMNDFPYGDKKLPYFGQHAHLPGKESGVLKVGDVLSVELLDD